MKKNITPAKQMIYIFSGIILFIIFYFLPTPKPIEIGNELVVLSSKGKLCIGLLLVAVFLWITEALPFHITALIAMLMMPLLKITDGLKVLKNGSIVEIEGMAAGYKEIVKLSFGNDLILFFLGVFLLSSAFSTTSLGKRLTFRMLITIGTETKYVILGFIILGTFLSMWISNVGVPAIMLPIAVGILKQAGCKPLESNFGKALMISTAWGPTFGGIATPAGCGPNPIAINLMRDLSGANITFLDWMKIGVPASIIMIPIGWILLLALFPLEIKKLPLSSADMRSQLKTLGKFSKEEVGTVITFAIVIFLWIFNPQIAALTGNRINFSISFVSILGGLLLFLPPFCVLTWEKASKSISWQSMLLIMASLGLGMMTYYTGAAKWIAVALLGRVETFSPVFLIFVVVSVVILLKLFLASNTVTGIVIIPIMISLAQSFNMDPWILVGPAAFTSSLGIILITQAPSNIIPHTSGYFSITDFAKSGIIMSIIMTLIITGVIAFIGPLTGVYSY